MNVSAKPVTAPIGGTAAEFEAWFDRRFDEKMAERETGHVPSMTLIATKGTLDMAYPPFILASTAAALGWSVSVFFTFYGLNLLKKDLDLKVTPMGNPAMPMKLPFGPQWLKNLEIKIPTVLMSTPGFQAAATGLMKLTLRSKGVADIAELRSLCIEADVKLVACQMTVDLFGMNRDDFIPEIADWVGATSFLPIAQKADVNLFV
jgi:peroxiredoxin family protein